MNTMQYIEIAGLIVGLAYLMFEYKASIWLWPVSILMPVIYIFVFLDAGFYAGTALNVYYFAASVYGWIKWRQKDSRQKHMPITHTPRKSIVPLAALVVATFIALAWILNSHTDSPAPVGDALISALSVGGMIMLAHKRLEVWFVWIAVNFLSVGVYFHTSLYFTALYFFISGVISIAAYFNWKKIMRNEQNKNTIPEDAG